MHRSLIFRSLCIFNLSTSLLESSKWIVLLLICTSMWCHISKLTAFHFDYIVKPIDKTFRICTAYSWLNHIANKIRWLSSVTTITLSFMKLIYVSFWFSLETDIRFEYKLNVCKILLKVTICVVLSSSVKNFTDFLPVITNVKFLSAERPILSGLYSVYKMSSDLSMK